MEEPREGTEAYRVKKEVEKKLKLAKDKKLGELFSDTYHNSIHSYVRYFKKDHNNKYIYPSITSVTESKIKNEKNDDVDVVEFVFGDKNYKVTERKWSGYIEGSYLDLNLFLNEQKIFGISETVEYDEWTTTYKPNNVTAYVNDKWIDDFKKINEHIELTRKQAQIEEAEDEQKTQEMKKNFGIS